VRKQRGAVSIANDIIPLMPDLDKKGTAEKRLLKIMSFIKKRPTRLRMSVFILNADNIKNDSESYKVTKTKITFKAQNNRINYGEPSTFKRPTCNTVGCFAGWTVLLKYGTEDTEKIKRIGNIDNTAARIIGIPGNFMIALFFPNCWFNFKGNEYVYAKNQKERVKVLENYLVNTFIPVLKKMNVLNDKGEYTGA
jgi:hypothetical protein